MGALDRITQLIDLSTTTNEKAEDLYNRFEFLVDKNAMGEKFKVFSVVSRELIKPEGSHSGLST